MKKAKIRIYTDIVFDKGSVISLGEAQSHYLCNVMKAAQGDEILCFNNRDGEFLCRIDKIDKKHTELALQQQTKAFVPSPDVWLMFAPLKKDQTDFVIQKATELGARRIMPVITQFCITDKVKKERFIAQAIEAAEQSRRRSACLRCCKTGIMRASCSLWMKPVAETKFVRCLPLPKGKKPLY